MSLINKMLQDLDKRHASDGGGKTLTQQLRPVQQSRKDWKRIAWEVGAGLLIGAGWAAWVVTQISPRPLVTDLVFQLQAKRHERAAAPQVIAGPQALQPAAVPAAPAPVPAQAPQLPPAAAMPATTPGPAPIPTAPKAVQAADADMLKLATEISTPFKESRVGAKPRAERKPAAVPAPKTAHKAETLPLAMAQGTQAGKAPSQISIDMHPASPAERAEDEFRKASALLNQGRVAEAIDRYKSTLKQDPRHAAARQALVGLLLENRRIDEAQQFLQEGLSVNPDRYTYAMLLARIQVDRGDLQGAHDLLRKHAASAAGDAEYLAFDAALLQRLGRHKEAVAEYKAALKLAPRAGLWWMGMGISLQAEQHDADALDAFQRAKAVGGLSPDLIAFVDQRMKQLQ